MMNRQTEAAPDHGISFRDALAVWVRIAALSFGGPAGQIAVMHRIIVEEKKWIGERRFLHALNYCMLLPGPEAQQLAIYLGWLLHRVKGGLVAGTLFVLPGFFAILGLSLLYALYGELTIVAGLFFGLKAAVMAIILQAVMRIGSRILRNNVMITVAVVAFVGIFFFDISFPLIVVGAGLLGYLGGRRGHRAFLVSDGHGDDALGLKDAQSALGDSMPPHTRPSLGWSLRIAALFLLLWLGPLALLAAFLGPDHIFTTIGLFFSKMAVVTFGGAYAVLAYVAQEAVQNYGWLAPGEMLDGLGMAETTPGPLIQVVQFVGFMGAFRDSGALSPLVAATFAALLTTWVTFTPCFLWIFLGAPYVEKIRANPAFSAALSVITAAVVGVILNLAIWFGLHVLFGEVEKFQAYGLQVEYPLWSSVNLPSLLLMLAAVTAIFRFRIGPFVTLLACAAIGVISSTAHGILG